MDVQGRGCPCVSSGNWGLRRKTAWASPGPMGTRPRPPPSLPPPRPNRESSAGHTLPGREVERRRPMPSSSATLQYGRHRRLQSPAKSTLFIGELETRFRLPVHASRTPLQLEPPNPSAPRPKRRHLIASRKTGNSTPRPPSSSRTSSTANLTPPYSKILVENNACHFVEELAEGGGMESAEIEGGRRFAGENRGGLRGLRVRRGGCGVLCD